MRKMTVDQRRMRLTPLPSSPARGEVELGHGLATSGTLALAGRVGEGAAPPTMIEGEH